MKKETINRILNETESGYDSMAEKFSQTRKFFWRNLEFIKDYAKDGDRVLDFGCGNGRLLELFKDKKIEYTGVDVSKKLLDLAKNKYSGEKIFFSKIVSSQSSLAFSDNFFNSIYSIAVFHHLPPMQAQKIAQELYRVTKFDGRIIITVWYLWQNEYWKNIGKNWMNKLKRKSDLDWNDCRIDFKNNEGKIFSRYHHAYTKREVGNIFQRAGFRVEKCEIVDGRNILLIGRRA